MVLTLTPSVTAISLVDLAPGDEAGGFFFAVGEGGEWAAVPGDVVPHGGDAVRTEPVMMPDGLERGE